MDKHGQYLRDIDQDRVNVLVDVFIRKPVQLSKAYEAAGVEDSRFKVIKLSKLARQYHHTWWMVLTYVRDHKIVCMEYERMKAKNVPFKTRRDFWGNSSLQTQAKSKVLYSQSRHRYTQLAILQAREFLEYLDKLPGIDLDIITNSPCTGEDSDLSSRIYRASLNLCKVSNKV